MKARMGRNVGRFTPTAEGSRMQWASHWKRDVVTSAYAADGSICGRS